MVIILIIIFFVVAVSVVLITRDLFLLVTLQSLYSLFSILRNVSNLNGNIRFENPAIMEDKKCEQTEKF